MKSIENCPLIAVRHLEGIGSGEKETLGLEMDFLLDIIRAADDKPGIKADDYRTRMIKQFEFKKKGGGVMKLKTNRKMSREEFYEKLKKCGEFSLQCGEIRRTSDGACPIIAVALEENLIDEEESLCVDALNDKADTIGLVMGLAAHDITVVMNAADDGPEDNIDYLEEKVVRNKILETVSLV